MQISTKMSFYSRFIFFFFLLTLTSSVYCTPPDSVLIGYVSKDKIIQNDDYKWGSEGYNQYKPLWSNHDIEFIKLKKTGLNITIVMGTWCEDSQNHVPKLLKILNQVHFPENQIKIYCVNREKQITEPTLKSMNINYVPTILIFKETIEIGRIVENPIESLEKDLLEIIKKTN